MIAHDSSQVCTCSLPFPSKGESISSHLESRMICGFPVISWMLERECSGLPNSDLKRPCNFYFKSCKSETPREKSKAILLERDQVDRDPGGWKTIGKSLEERPEREQTWSSWQQAPGPSWILQSSSANTWVQLHEWVQTALREAGTNSLTKPCLNSWPTESWAIKWWWF